MSECSVGIDSSTCTDMSLLSEVVEIKLTKTKKSTDKLEILKEIYECENELCVLEKGAKDPTLPSSTKSELEESMKSKIKPLGPSNSNKLIDNFNIENIFYSFSKNPKYKFYAIPFQMIDFKETKSELQTVDIAKLIEEGYTTMGTIVNTDVSSGRGKHWFAIFCDMRSDHISLEYFNSSGTPPYEQINKWLCEKNNELRSKGINSTIVIATRIMHQKSKTECGVYSLYYIYKRLEGESYKEFNRKIITDSEMFMFRSRLFRSE